VKFSIQYPVWFATHGSALLNMESESRVLPPFEAFYLLLEWDRLLALPEKLDFFSPTSNGIDCLLSLKLNF